MELPRALEPWRSQLSIFPPDLAVALGGIVDNLSLLFGPMLSPDNVGLGEPDGVGGIGRRGSFERLLATEWALSEEAPLEFLRRVSTGELSFLEIAHQKSSVARQSVALFDVGPDARGGPRVVLLAALILLAQRAAAGRASFSWGILQDESAELIVDVNEESVVKLVKAVSTKRPKSSDFIRWMVTIAETGAEVWLVGGSALANSNAELFPYRVEIEDSVDPENLFDVCVTVFAEGKKPRSVNLALPTAATSIRLIRDPFQVATATTKKSATILHPETNIVFGKSDRQLFLRGAQGELITIPIPNSPNVQIPPNPRIFAPPNGEVLVGAGHLQHGKNVVAVTRTSDHFIIHTLSKRASASQHHQQFEIDRLSDPLLPNYVAPVTPLIGALFQVGNTGQYYFHDGRSALLRFGTDGVVLIDTSVTCVSQDGNTLYWVKEGDPPSLCSLKDGNIETRALATPAIVRGAVFAQGGKIAAQRANSLWMLLEPTGHLGPFAKRFDCNCVLGVVTSSTQTGLVVLDPSRMRISIEELGDSGVWLHSPDPIRTAAASIGAWVVAFITEDDELCIYSREFKALVLRIRMGAS